MQEGLLRMWKLAPTLELEGVNASLRFAHKVVRNLALMEARRLRRQVNTNPGEKENREPEPLDPSPPPDPILLLEEEITSIDLLTADEADLVCPLPEEAEET